MTKKAVNKVREVKNPMLYMNGQRLIPSFGYALVRVKELEHIPGSKLIAPTGQVDPRGLPMMAEKTGRDRLLVALYVIDPGEGFVLMNGEICQPLKRGDRVYLKPGTGALRDDKMYGKDIGIISIEDVMVIHRADPRAVN